MILKRTSKSSHAFNGQTCFTDEEIVKSSSTEEDSSFATIDGGMITQDEVDLAVNKGAGIFIGNYFVGIIESYQCYINSPFGRFS